MGILIYDHPFSPYAQKCKIALREKNVPYETQMPNAIGTGNQDTPFLVANPRGEVPALIDDGFAIFDSSVIVEYIEDKWPTPALRPASPQDRARARMIEEIMDTQYEAIAWATGEINVFGRSSGEEAAALMKRAEEQTRNLQAWLTRELGERAWFNDESFGWGDLCVIPFLNGNPWKPDVKSTLGQWQARCNERASVKACLADIAAITAASSNSIQSVADMVKKGLFKREYRDHRLEWMLRSGGARVVTEGMANGSIRFSNEIQ